MKNIEMKPTTEIKENEKKVITLEDKDYLLITAIQELTNAIKYLTARLAK